MSGMCSSDAAQEQESAYQKRNPQDDDKPVWQFAYHGLGPPFHVPISSLLIVYRAEGNGTPVELPVSLPVFAWSGDDDVASILVELQG